MASDILQKYEIKELYYFSLIENLNSMLKVGILPKNVLNRANRQHHSFANNQVQYRRDQIDIQCSDSKKRNIHDVVPLYFTPLTPTLFCKQDIFTKIFFAVVNPHIIFEKGFHYAFSDGNAASNGTNFYNSTEYLFKINWTVIKAKYWADFQDGKRMRNAEMLIYPIIPNNYILKYVVINKTNKILVENILFKFNLNKPVEINESFFFGSSIEPSSQLITFSFIKMDELYSEEYDIPL